MRKAGSFGTTLGCGTFDEMTPIESYGTSCPSGWRANSGNLSMDCAVGEWMS
jgi:hypothetical protein